MVIILASAVLYDFSGSRVLFAFYCSPIRDWDGRQQRLENLNLTKSTLQLDFGGKFGEIVHEQN